MARRVPRLLVPIAIALVAMVLALWAVSPSQAQENPPPPAVPAPVDRDLLNNSNPDRPNGPRDCGSCMQDGTV
jgi:hypothetical protein